MYTHDGPGSHWPGPTGPGPPSCVSFCTFYIMFISFTLAILIKYLIYSYTYLFLLTYTYFVLLSYTYFIYIHIRVYLLLIHIYDFLIHFLFSTGGNLRFPAAPGVLQINWFAHIGHIKIMKGGPQKQTNIQRRLRQRKIVVSAFM